MVNEAIRKIFTHPLKLLIEVIVVICNKDDN